jgi:TolB-like protein/Tfp pilus assembly protein PilF
MKQNVFTPDEMPTHPTATEESEREEARRLLVSLRDVDLESYSVVGHCFRFDEQSRNHLKEFRHRLAESLFSRSRTPSNFLLWGFPGSGKSYLVQQIVKSLPSDVHYQELNLSQIDEDSLRSGLDYFVATPGPGLCFIDEVDARSDQTWPYETLLPYLDPPVPRGFPTVFGLAGSGGKNLKELTERIRGRPKGSDLLSRIPRGNEFTVASLGVGDKILVSIAQLVLAAHEEGHTVHEIEKLALFFLAVHPSFTSARQLRSRAAQCALRIPPAEDRIRYDYLFGAGDPENKQFWTESGSVRPGLEDSFVRAGAGSLLETARSDATVSRVSRPEKVIMPWKSNTDFSGAPAKHRVAVLPFTNMSPDPSDLYFADGLTEELITVLSQLRELRVIARTSVMQYKSTTKAISQIGTDLDVSSVLEGSVRRAGNRLRITAQLIDVDSQEHVWAKSYDRELDDVFVIQTEIAKQVADALKIELGPTEAARLEAGSEVRPESYLAYLKGRTLLHTPSRASTEAARKQFELAISLDARNAAAYSGLADATSMMGWWYPGEPYELWHEAAQRFASHALELDPNLAEAHASLAMVLWGGYGRDYPALEREFGLALSLNPSYALARRMYAAVLQDEGRADEAISQLSLAEAADPLAAQNLTALAVALLWRGRFDEAWTKIQKLGQLDPSLPGYHGCLARYHFARGDVGKAIEEMKRAEQLASTEPTLGKLYRALYLALSGESEQSREVLQAVESSPISVITVGFTIIVYAELGDVDACYRTMEKARGVLSMQGLRLDPRLEPIRRDRRFAPFLKKIGLG